MALVNFKKGLLAKLSAAPKAEGTFYVTTDERAIYLDVDGDTRIRLGDFQEYATLEALKAVTNPSTTALYYIKDINCLAKFDGESYVQINPDKGAIDIEVAGSGEANGVTATYDQTTRKITLTMSKAFITANEVDAKITAAVGDIGSGKTVKDYVDDKTKGIASDEALTALDERVTAAEGDIDALEELVGETAVSEQISTAVSAAKEELTTKITAAQTAADAAQKDVDAIKADYLKEEDKSELEDAIELKADKTDVTALEARVGDLEENDEEQDGRLDALESKITGLSGAMHFKGVVSTDPTTIKEGYENGDVVVYGNKEYVWNEATSAFVEFGDVTEVSGRVTTLEGEMDSAEGRLDAVEGKLNGITDTVTGYVGTQIDAAKTALTGSEDGINATTIQGAAKEAIDYTNDALDDIDADIAEINETLEGLDEKYDEIGAADTAESNAKGYTDEKLTWGSF